MFRLSRSRARLPQIQCLCVRCFEPTRKRVPPLPRLLQTRLVTSQSGESSAATSSETPVASFPDDTEIKPRKWKKASPTRPAGEEPDPVPLVDLPASSVPAAEDLTAAPYRNRAGGWISTGRLPTSDTSAPVPTRKQSRPRPVSATGGKGISSAPKAQKSSARPQQDSGKNADQDAVELLADALVLLKDALVANAPLGKRVKDVLMKSSRRESGLSVTSDYLEIFTKNKGQRTTYRALDAKIVPAQTAKESDITRISSTTAEPSKGVSAKADTKKGDATKTSTTTAKSSKATPIKADTERGNKESGHMDKGNAKAIAPAKAKQTAMKIATGQPPKERPKKISQPEKQASSEVTVQEKGSTVKPRRASSHELPPQSPEKKPSRPGPAPRRTVPRQQPHTIRSVTADNIALSPVDAPQPPVPSLKYGLDRALFNPGIYHLQDPRSKVYNFDPYLASIMPVQEFDFNALKRYVTSSEDNILIAMAAKHKKKYTGSTSSMTSLLIHFHFLLSAWREVNLGNMSRQFRPESYNFTRITRAPSAAFLHCKGDVYAIDADKELDNANVLTLLGQSMEKLLTLETPAYERYRISKSHQLSEEERNASSSYHYTTLGDFLMRSQLDAHDPRLPGSGMFDLKTRAVVSIRMAQGNAASGGGYEIRSRFGQWESFEREYFDMIRAAFLKYSLQVRMGRMDGIYVAFHNTQRIFGFQYISINEMDNALHSSTDTRLGDDEFKLSLHLLNEVLNMATARFPNRSLQIHVETRPSEASPFMYVFARPVDSQAIAKVQATNKARVEAIEQNILQTVPLEVAEDESPETSSETEEHLPEALPPEDSDYHEAQSRLVWETMMRKVEETMDNEELGIPSLRDTIEDALEESGLLYARSQAETNRYIDALLQAITNPEVEAAVASIEETVGEASDVDSAILVAAAGEEEILDGGVAEAIDAGEELTLEAAKALVLDAEDQIALNTAEETAVDVGEDAGEENPSAASEEMVLDTSEEVVLEAEEHLLPDPSDEATPDRGDDALLGSRTDMASSAEDSSVAVEGADATGETTDQATEAENSSQPDGIIFEDPRLGPHESEEQLDGLPLDNISLKDLIIKMAAQIDAKAMSHTQQEDLDPATEDELPEAPRNKRFERILKALAGSATSARSPDDTTEDERPATPPQSTAAAEDAKAPPHSADTGGGGDELLGLILTIRNKLGDMYVRRPNGRYYQSSHPNISQRQWTVDYAIEELPAERAAMIYKNVRDRRKTLFKPPATATSSDFYAAKLRSFSQRGRKFRAEEDEKARDRPVEVYGAERARTWDEVFGPGEKGEEEGKESTDPAT